MQIKYCRLAPLNPLIEYFLYLLEIQYSPLEPVTACPDFRGRIGRSGVLK